MSKIGKKNIIIPDQVTVTVTPDEVVVRGPKGELKTALASGITVKIEGNELMVERQNNL